MTVNNQDFLDAGNKLSMSAMHQNRFAPPAKKNQPKRGGKPK